MRFLEIIRSAIRSAASFLFAIGRGVLRTLVPQVIAAGNVVVHAVASPFMVAATWIWQAAVPFVVALVIDLVARLRTGWSVVSDDYQGQQSRLAVVR